MYYCNIITQQAWGVPSILAEFPKTPTDTSSSSEKGYFALFMLLLFHPWRHLQTDLLSAAFSNLSHPFDPWEALHAYFEKWHAQQVTLEAEVKQQYSHGDLVSNGEKRELYLLMMALCHGSLINIGLHVVCQ